MTRILDLVSMMIEATSLAARQRASPSVRSVRLALLRQWVRALTMSIGPRPSPGRRLILLSIWVLHLLEALTSTDKETHMLDLANMMTGAMILVTRRRGSQLARSVRLAPSRQWAQDPMMLTGLRLSLRLRLRLPSIWAPHHPVALS